MLHPAAAPDASAGGSEQVARLVDSPRAAPPDIGGLAHQETYRQAVEAAGLRIEHIRRNDYRFLSAQAQNASATYGVHSVSLLAIRPGKRSRRNPHTRTAVMRTGNGVGSTRPSPGQ